MSVDELLVTALDFIDPVERRQYLDRACAGDEPLRREVESLLAAHARLQGFLEKRPALPAPDSASGAAAKGFTEEPGERIGRYKLLEPIGEGGFGVVWVAEQEEPVRRRVALKIIKLGMDTRSVVARFEAERQALALMDHPHIAKVFDGGASDAGRPYFVMELVKGIPITQYCDQCKLSMRERLELVAQVCRAVQHAHQKGIIHRDLKPSNVLVTEQDGRPVPKVIDFGIAKASEGRLTDKTLFTGFQQWIGTPSYMSPEQAGLASLDVDTRSDVYSLGVLLYELLTGRTPFDTQALLKEGYEAVMRTIREVEPPKPSTRRAQDLWAGKSEIRNLKSEIDADLDWIVMKCLEKDRSRRYETANGLAADLERHLHHEPVQARPPSAAYRWGKFARKHRTAVAVVAGFVVLLTGATVVSTTLALWANRERDGAVKAQKAETKERKRAEEASKTARTERDKASQARDAEREARLREEEHRKTAETAQARAASAEADAKEKELQARKSEAAAKENERKARDSEVEARTVLQFFQDKVLAATRPEGEMGGLGREATIRAAVDAAEPTISRAFTNQPLVEASIRETLGSTYRLLGEFPLAIAQHKRALAICREKLDADDPRTLDSLNGLALDYSERGWLNEAISLFEESLELSRKKQGTNGRGTLAAMNNLATAYHKADRLADAVPLLENALNLTRLNRRTNDADTMEAKITINLAESYRDLNRLPDALPLLEASLEFMRVTPGPEHPDTLQAMVNLASAYSATERLPEALSLLEKAVPLMEQKLGPDHATTLKAMHNLAGTYKRGYQLKKAFPLDEKVLRRSESKFGSNDPVTLSRKNDLANDYLDAGRIDEAVPLLRELERSARATDGAESRTLADALSSLGECLLRQKKHEQAEPVLRESLTIWESRAPNSWHPFDTRVLLGMALLGQKKYADAEPLLLSGREGLMKPDVKMGANNRAVRVADATEYLIYLYEALGKPEQAAEWRKKLNDAPKPPANVQP